MALKLGNKVGYVAQVPIHLEASTATLSPPGDGPMLCKTTFQTVKPQVAYRFTPFQTLKLSLAVAQMQSQLLDHVRVR